jgi:hypothetical protein
VETKPAPMETLQQTSARFTRSYRYVFTPEELPYCPFNYAPSLADTCGTPHIRIRTQEDYIRVKIMELPMPIEMKELLLGLSLKKKPGRTADDAMIAEATKTKAASAKQDERLKKLARFSSNGKAK